LRLSRFLPNKDRPSLGRFLKQPGADHHCSVSRSPHSGWVRGQVEILGDPRAQSVTGSIRGHAGRSPHGPQDQLDDARHRRPCRSAQYREPRSAFPHRFEHSFLKREDRRMRARRRCAAMAGTAVCAASDSGGTLGFRGRCTEQEAAFPAAFDKHDQMHGAHGRPSRQPVKAQPWLLKPVTCDRWLSGTRLNRPPMLHATQFAQPWTFSDRFTNLGHSRHGETHMKTRFSTPADSRNLGK
jgi:hypothetical protein